MMVKTGRQKYMRSLEITVRGSGKESYHSIIGSSAGKIYSVYTKVVKTSKTVKIGWSCGVFVAARRLETLQYGWSKIFSRICLQLRVPNSRLVLRVPGPPESSSMPMLEAPFESGRFRLESPG